MDKIFADLQIHIGRSNQNHPIKITASRTLNFANIAQECAQRKGIQMAGIIDCASPYVIEDIEEFLKQGEACEIDKGGIIYQNKVCLLLGSEIETSETREDGHKGSAHNLCYFPKLKDIKAFSQEMSHHIRNITLSSQRADISAYQLLDIVEKYHGILIPAHAFTPHKSFYGNCTDRLQKIFREKYDRIPAIELGLSADTELADHISELADKTFLTNSDAHSLPRIGREYNQMQVEDINYQEFLYAIQRKNGRKIVANYGMDPKLGKYHRTYCEDCKKNIVDTLPATTCPDCDSRHITMGVLDRIITIQDEETAKSPKHRPPYIYQIPLTYIPGVGPKVLEKLLKSFQTEMNVLHEVSYDDLVAVVGEKIATNIEKARKGEIRIQAGGGGVYGKITE